MVKVTINRKEYRVKEMQFGEYAKIEEQGFSIIDAFRKKQLLLIAMGFTCVAADCDREEAERLITQHVLGGGNIVDIANAFAEAVSESDFFQKMLGVTQTETPKTQKNKEDGKDQKQED